jgi:hypothetical protein
MLIAFPSKIFPARSAIQTAEPPEAVDVSTFRFHNQQQPSYMIVGPGGEAFCEKLCIQCILRCIIILLNES